MGRDFVRLIGNVVSASRNNRESVQADAEALLAAGVQSVDDLLELLDEPRDPIDCPIACWFLARLPAPPKARRVRALERASTDSSATIRYSACLALGDIGSALALKRLEILVTDLDAEVQMAAINSLGRVGSARACHTLMRVLSDSRAGSRVRGAAAEALGSIGDTRCVPLLLRQLSDVSPEVRLFCAASLGHLEDERALRPLRRCVERDTGRTRRYGSVRRAAALAIGRIERARQR